MAYLTGFHGIEERIKAGGAAGPLLVAKAGPRAREIAGLAAAHKIRIDRVGTFDLDRLAPGHRGIALEVEDRGISREIRVEQFLADLGDRPDGMVLILDEITDPHNYGAILRTCDQFGVDLAITRHRRIAKHPDVIARTSAGAAAWMPVAQVPNLPRAGQALKDAGFWLYAADMSGEAAYTKDLTGRVALILGGEGTGVTRLLRDQCDGCIGIPSAGRIDSLNVSVAAGVLCYEVLRQRASRRG
ncbi:MAG: 23S rRNA (guanosine(2251)-2'-O)-methyltransferase RlmB [Spirochaetaceae bacterium]|jgi:23S rRNA (guanosine2251-2'-O)-methyltransferase|nr:23S rRNA (guanosine(2251)-2'-O)-methyltransferase RlmB [Spirochaetaceae bacterium]